MSTNTKDLYQKERRRIQNTISRYRRAGFEVEFELPKIPKRITEASVRKLSRITPKNIQKKTWVPDLETGELIPLSKSISQGNTIKALSASIEQINIPKITDSISAPAITTPISDTVPQYDDVILEAFESLIASYRDGISDIINNWYQALFTNMSKSEVADFLQSTNEKGLWLTPEEAYREEIIYQNIADMMAMLDLSAGEQNEIINAIDLDTDFFAEFYDV